MKGSSFKTEMGSIELLFIPVQKEEEEEEDIY